MLCYFLILSPDTLSVLRLLLLRVQLLLEDRLLFYLGLLLLRKCVLISKFYLSKYFFTVFIVIMGCLHGRTIIIAAVNEILVLEGKRALSRSLVVGECLGSLERAAQKVRSHRLLEGLGSRNSVQEGDKKVRREHWNGAREPDHKVHIYFKNLYPSLLR